MDGPPFLVATLVNRDCFAQTLIDTGCLSYGVINARFVKKHNLQRIKIKPRTMSGFKDEVECVIDEVAVVRIDIDGHVEQEVFFYIVPYLAYDMILGRPWFVKNDVVFAGKKPSLFVHSTGTRIWNRTVRKYRFLDCIQVAATTFGRIWKQRKRSPGVEVFATTLKDIEKALEVRTRKDPKQAVPKWLRKFLPLFDRTKAEELPPLRGKAVDHAIEIEDKNGKPQQPPWGPLYGMSKGELLVLRKTLTEYLDKGFIRVSNSPAAAPVLFVRKPGGGLRFCVDYRGLNQVTRKDRYPLPLIHETLRNVGKAKWYTKLDVIAAFHKIRIAEGDEWKTAFRTRYGLYEWMVTPFGLANAPSTFQRYINWALRDFLDEFCSAYIDDVLIYTDGTREQHQEHVRRVCERLDKAGLQVDIDKCEFEVKSTKYLGFILEVGKGVRMDPEKVKAILEWESPKSVKAVRSFLGFANFYRKFIANFSELTLPLTQLVRKDIAFQWTDKAEESFQALKQKFTIGPDLVQFDSDRPTILETDSSGWSVGGVLLQLVDGLWRPCAFYSKKNNPAECNYEIYDKEMLAIVRCFEEWEPDLRSLEHFEVRTDHKNLEYFMTARQLTERQMRWSLILSKFNFHITYIPGTQNGRADALSRREQDMPSSGLDERIAYRTMQLLKPEMLRPPSVRLAPTRTQPPDTMPTVFPNSQGNLDDLVSLWDEARKKDQTYEAMVSTLASGQREFPRELDVRVSVGDCSLSQNKELLFRERRWVPDDEVLRTNIIQKTHDSVVGGHPGREVTSSLLSRQFYWPGMLQEVRRFVRNCDKCRANTSWNLRKQGFLKPLPIPSRIWQEISIDFIDKLPMSNGCTSLCVITDRLGKGVILEGCKDMTAETVTDIFVRRIYSQHGLPAAIVSDRGTQFTSNLWKRVCQLLGVVRRVSTAFHPETDGSTERMNQNVEKYIRTFSNWAQDDWQSLLPMAELSINNHDSSSTGVSPFFLSHGYHVDPLQLSDDSDSDTSSRESPIAQGENIVRKLRQASEWAQASMAVAQQNQEEATNRLRRQATRYKVGDKVWLRLKNVRTTRQSKKFDRKNAKYTVIQVVGSHAYKLDTPPGIHPVFHSDLLQPAGTDPLPSQVRTDTQPPPIIVADEEEWEVEKILDEKVVRRGRKQSKQYLVQWTGYDRPTWEPEDAMGDAEALDAYLVRNRVAVLSTEGSVYLPANPLL
jgi:transposase InsO family protein/predicted aspartyl protease